MDPDLTDSHSDLVTAGPQSLWLARIVLRQDDPFIGFAGSCHIRSRYS
jgi:hypothetical protein